MTHFTVLHWLALLIIVVLFILVIILTLRNSDETFPLPTILTIAFVALLMFFLAIFALDKYTKVAQLENVVQKKILINESFSISGQIRNVGNFEIGKCTLEVKLFNESLEKNGDTPLFRPKSVFDDFFTKDSSSSFRVDTSKDFVIAENLQKGEMRNFAVFIRYPASYAKPYARYELFCH